MEPNHVGWRADLLGPFDAPKVRIALGLSRYSEAPRAIRPCGAHAHRVGLGRFEQPPASLSDTSGALVSAGIKGFSPILRSWALASVGGDDTGGVTAP